MASPRPAKSRPLLLSRRQARAVAATRGSLRLLLNGLLIRPPPCQEKWCLSIGRNGPDPRKYYLTRYKNVLYYKHQGRAAPRQRVGEGNFRDRGLLTSDLFAERGNRPSSARRSLWKPGEPALFFCPPARSGVISAKKALDEGTRVLPGSSQVLPVKATIPGLRHGYPAPKAVHPPPRKK